MKRFILLFLVASGVFGSIEIGYPCFDTFLFLQKKSMVYPKSYLAVDFLGEYSVNSAANPEADSSFTNYNMYYGIMDSLSVQAGISTVENTRGAGSYQAESWAIKGVYNALSMNGGFYNLDVILAHHTGISSSDNSAGFSLPNLFNVSDFTFVVHPTVEVMYSGDTQYNFGGHGGVFYRIKDTAVIGLGAEFASAQSGSMLNKRMTEGELAASIFAGFNLGNVYLQNEFAKGLMNSRDFGYAITVKGFLDIASL